MLSRSCYVLAALLVLAAAAALPAQAKTSKHKQKLDFPKEIDEDFQFELRNLYTDRKQGARMNIFVKYRYYTKAIKNDYTTEAGAFDFSDMEKVIRSAVPVGGAGIPGDAFLEVVNRDVAEKVWKKFPIRGLSIRMEIQGMSSGGLPDHYSSTVTAGDIEPWVSLINHFPGCDGMDTDDGNKACRLALTWKDTDADASKKKGAAKLIAGKHDKPAKCDFCA